MKALTKKFGEIIILSTENKNSIKVSVNGEVKHLMPSFVQITNLDGSAIDFSTLEIREKIEPIVFLPSTEESRKRSELMSNMPKKQKLADIIANGVNHATYNHKTKKFNNDGI